MKIAFFTEGELEGKCPRDYLNMRTDMAWLCSLDAIRIPYHKIKNNTTKFDLGICIIPKKLNYVYREDPTQELVSEDQLSRGVVTPEIINSAKQQCLQIASMQEGPHWNFQDYPLEDQIKYFNILQEMDFLFVHNEIDRKYFKGLVDKECRVLQSLMVEDPINTDTLTKMEDRQNVIIGGNFCYWYGGFDSFIVAQQFESEIYAPSMGRKIENEDQMPGLNHLPYVHWAEWIQQLSKFKYGIHLMRTHAAGTFALNCAYLGIPCIGYRGLDTQEILHPECSVDMGDLSTAKKIAQKLRKDEEFYVYCCNEARKRYMDNYVESVFKEKFYNG
tara:strand:- start:1039 stop:2031 length:993 start_codon:yes stop_codon:yes gene_type:complete